MRLVPYPRRTQLYDILAQLPDGNVLELPVPRVDALPFNDARYLYTSTFHWKTLVNGYSGYYPQSYLRRLIHLSTFPSEVALEQIKDDKVRYIVVHEEAYRDTAVGGRVVEELMRLGGKPLGKMYDGWSLATLIDVSALMR
jgi:hypothetical protein